MTTNKCYLRVRRNKPAEVECRTAYDPRRFVKTIRKDDPLWLQFADAVLTGIPYRKGVGAHGTFPLWGDNEQWLENLPKRMQKWAMNPGATRWRDIVREYGWIPPYLVCDQLSQILLYARGHLDAKGGNAALAQWYADQNALTRLVDTKPFSEQLQRGATMFYLKVEKEAVKGNSVERVRFEDEEIIELRSRGLDLAIFHSDTVISVDESRIEIFGTGAMAAPGAADTADEEEDVVGGNEKATGRRTRRIKAIKKKLAVHPLGYYFGFVATEPPPWWVASTLKRYQDPFFWADHDRWSTTVRGHRARSAQ
ncbi:MAG: hypothetical protein ACR2GY_02690 [Phycisphaerales bacterium]